MISNEAFCLDLKQQIVTAYEKSGNQSGWRLLYSPSTVLENASVAFIGLNPGGAYQTSDHAEFSMTRGSAYVVETWGRAEKAGTSPLQKQVRALCDGLSVKPEEVLAGNLVPFRSPSWDSLENTSYSLRFGEALWKTVLKRSNPSLVIGMGREVHAPLRRILGAAKDQATIPVGWGNVTATRCSFSNGSLVVLPHHSRFGIVTREESASALRDLFGERWMSR